MAAPIAPIQLPTSVAPVASTAAPTLALTAGQVVTAEVLQTLEANLVQVAIDGVVIAALSEIPLQAGTTLQLAVSQTPAGAVRLSIVPNSGEGAAPSPNLISSATASSVGSTAPVQTPLAVTQAPVVPTSDVETSAIANLVQTAAPRQASLAPLFADLPVVIGLEVVPSPVQHSAAQLLALRPELSERLSADDLRTAFQQSGVFLETTLAAGGQIDASGDVKAALTVLRGALSAWIGAEPAAAEPQASPVIAAEPAPAPTAAPTLSPQPPAAASGPAGTAALAQETGASVPLAPAVTPQVGLMPGASGETLAPAPTPMQAAAEPLPLPEDQVPAALPRAQAAFNAALAMLDPGPAAAAADPSLHALRDPVQILQAALRIARAFTPTADVAPISQPVVAQATDSKAVPPPFRGSPPSPQPVAAPSLPLDASPRAIGEHLLQQTDAALARQTLLQVASLPDRADAVTPQGFPNAPDANAPRWAFEIPFMTPQGTAVAQFAIERDGGSGETVEPAQRIWRARFTLNIEPTGPVHALVSLNGDKTAVRLWAERPETALQLRAHSDRLAQALRAVNLQPGDIAVANGAPGPAAGPGPGRFLDRAS